jgi:threonine dehydrogenase-like Zn-dependent dehydrogenase
VGRLACIFDDDPATPMGHEYCGIVEEVGSAVKSVKGRQFVIGSSFASDNVSPACQIGYQSSYEPRTRYGLTPECSSAS